MNTDHLTPGRLRDLREGTVVADRDGDLWVRTTDYDHHRRGFILMVENGTPYPAHRPGLLFSSTELAAQYGPVTFADAEGVNKVLALPVRRPSGAYMGEPEVADVSFDEKPGDPDTADNSLDLDDLYRAGVDTIVVDRDGDLWRRQTAFLGSRVWVLVREDGVAPLGYTPAIASSSRRLIDRFGPIAFAPVEDAKAALALTPREVECVLGGDDEPDPEHALDADAVVEAALDRARCALTGDGEHVEVAITRDADGKVRVRTAVTGEVES